MEQQANSNSNTVLTTAPRKPDWATGDPFFDTMAGMEGTPEYQEYLNSLLANSQAAATSATHPQDLSEVTASLSLQGGGSSNVIAPMDPTSSSSSSTSTTATTTGACTNGSEPAATTGIDHWNRTREKWTGGRWHAVQSANSVNPALSAIHPGNHDAIYDSLVYDRKRLSKPIPLPLVVRFDTLWERCRFCEEEGIILISELTPLFFLTKNRCRSRCL